MIFPPGGISCKWHIIASQRCRGETVCKQMPAHITSHRAGSSISIHSSRVSVQCSLTLLLAPFSCFSRRLLGEISVSSAAKCFRSTHQLVIVVRLPLGAQPKQYLEKEHTAQLSASKSSLVTITRSYTYKMRRS